MTRRLFELLPAVHRLRDAENGGPLRELIDLLAEQLAVLEEEARTSSTTTSSSRPARTGSRPTSAT